MRTVSTFILSLGQERRLRECCRNRYSSTKNTRTKQNTFTVRVTIMVIARISPALALAEVPELKDREIRVRVVIIEPGGHVAVHEHKIALGLLIFLAVIG